MKHGNTDKLNLEPERVGITPRPSAGDVPIGEIHHEGKKVRNHDQDRRARESPGMFSQVENRVNSAEIVGTGAIALVCENLR